MARLECRVLGRGGDNTLLYAYDEISKAEVAARFNCDYFLKNKALYEKISCAVEPAINVIYLKRVESSSEAKAQTSMAQGLQMELRQFSESEGIYYPLIYTFTFIDEFDLLLYLQSDYIEWLGHKWHKTSAEVNEDKRHFIYYGRPTVS